MNRWRRQVRTTCRVALTLLSLGCAGEPEHAPGPPRGGTLARGYGVTIRKVAYVPEDRLQTFGLVGSCEARDSEQCADRSWSPEEVAAVANAARTIGELSGFQTSYVETGAEVRVHALPASNPAPGCTNGSVTCWFGATDCVESAETLLDASGTPVSDQYKDRSWSFLRCTRWRIEVSMDNLYAWADFLGLERWRVLRAMVLHEMGHSLGLEHTSSGLMRGHLPICYFIEPGHPRDKYDPNAPSDAFQRFECVEGVKPPELALSQRQKLDAYRLGGDGWSILTLH
ncbi:MAG: hypothetical protein RL033_3724 [Pseudomonadota bacterium]